jgi:hypothetical protein
MVIRSILTLFEFTKKYLLILLKKKQNLATFFFSPNHGCGKGANNFVATKLN